MSVYPPPKNVGGDFNSDLFSTADGDKADFPTLQGTITCPNGIKFGDGTFQNSASGGTELTVKEDDADGPVVSSVNTIIVSNGTLQDNTNGVVTITTGGGSGSGSITVSDNDTSVSSVNTITIEGARLFNESTLTNGVLGDARFYMGIGEIDNSSKIKDNITYSSLITTHTFLLDPFDTAKVSGVNAEGVTSSGSVSNYTGDFKRVDPKATVKINSLGIRHFQFDGNDDFIDFATSNSLIDAVPLQGSTSLWSWFNLEDIELQNNSLLSTRFRDSTSGPGYGIELKTSSGFYSCRIGDNSSNGFTAFPTTVAVTKGWHMYAVTMTYNSSNSNYDYVLYLDGVSIHTFSSDYTVPNSGVRIGAAITDTTSVPSASVTTANIGHCGITNSALSSTDIQTIYNELKPYYTLSGIFSGDFIGNADTATKIADMATKVHANTTTYATAALTSHQFLLDPFNTTNVTTSGITSSGTVASYSGTYEQDASVKIDNLGVRYFAFDGAGDHIDFATSPSSGTVDQIAAQGTLSMWVWSTIGTDANADQFFTTRSPNTPGGISIFKSSGVYQIGFAHSTNTLDTVNTNVQASNGWQMVALTLAFNSGNNSYDLLLYVNGELKFTGTQSEYAPGNDGVRIGYSRTDDTITSGITTFDGKIGHCGITNTALSATDITNIYNELKPYYLTEGLFLGHFLGDVNGDVIGNLTGDVTGNVTGDLTGNVDAGTGTITTTDVLFTGGTNTGVFYEGTPGTTGEAMNFKVANNSLLNVNPLSIKMGLNALGSVTGTGNIGIGGDAGTSTTSGILNVAIGDDSLRTNTTGNFNVAIGTNAGKDSLGSNNVFIGLDAGENSGTTFSYNDCVAIGTDALPTASNQIVLGTISRQVIAPGRMEVGLGLTAASISLSETLPTATLSGTDLTLGTQGLTYETFNYPHAAGDPAVTISEITLGSTNRVNSQYVVSVENGSSNDITFPTTINCQIGTGTAFAFKKNYTSDVVIPAGGYGILTIYYKSSTIVFLSASAFA